jgi:hypothetical protein
MKKVDTLIRDIYRLLEHNNIPEGVNLEEQCAQFGEEMAGVLMAALQPETRSGNLRLSAIGKPERQLYHKYRGVSGEELRGATYIKFLYGHLVEAMVLALTRCAGHTVTGQQKEVEVGGVKGHIDGYIDGVLMDVKSCSSFGFKKFHQNTLHQDDPFGYIGQLHSYAYAEGQETYGWLAMDKANGTLAWLQYDTTNKDANYAQAIDWDPLEKVTSLKQIVAGNTIPSVCYEPVPDGKSGNFKLATGCSYCEYKHTCWPDLKTYIYASGPRYLTTVVREPKVMTIPKEF